MKKNIKLLIGTAAGVAVLAAALTAVLLMPSQNDSTEKADDDMLMLVSKTELTPEDISVRNESGEYQLLAYEYDHLVLDTSDDEDEGDTIHVIYTMQEQEALTLDKDITDTLLTCSQQLKARQLVDRNSSKLADYGLQPPRAEVSITYSDNDTKAFCLGSNAPDNKGVYLCMKDSSDVFLISSDQVSVFFTEKLQLFDKQLTDNIGSMESLTLSGSFYDKPLSICRNSYPFYQGSYLMDSPTRSVCDTEKLGSLSTKISGLKAPLVEAVNVTDEQLAKYHLDQPYQQISLTGDEGETAFLSTKANKQGWVYAMRSGGRIIYKMNIADADWYELQRDDLLSKELLRTTGTQTQRVVIRADGTEKAYEVKREIGLNKDYYEIGSFTATCEGKEVTFNNLSAFVSNLSVLQRCGEKPDSLQNARELMRVQVTYFDNSDDFTDTLIVYQQEKDKRCFAVLNGTIESYVDNTSVSRLLEQIPLINDTELLPALSTEAESE